MLFANLLQVMAPLLLRYFLVSLSDDSASHSSSLVFVGLLFTTQMGMSFALVHYHYLGQVVGSQVKATLTAIIFEKSLKLSNNESNNWTDGKISNLITVDSQRIESASICQHDLERASSRGRGFGNPVLQSYLERAEWSFTPWLGCERPGIQHGLADVKTCGNQCRGRPQDIESP